MRALFIGGTGTISTEITKLALLRGWTLTLLNRGGRRNEELPPGVEVLTCDITDEAQVAQLLSDRSFDVVADFIVFTQEQLARDLRLFSGKTRQYFFISSASAYQKPVENYRITESTPLHNPYWEYSRQKIACEEMLTEAYRKDGFPMTIIRPSHTYLRSVPVALHGDGGCWQVIERIRQGKPVVIPGDGTSLWTLTHSRDFAKAFVGLMGHPKAIGGAFQITSDEQLTWDQATVALGAALGIEPILYHVSTDFLVACNPDLSGPMQGDKSCSVVFDNSKVKGLVPEYVAEIPFHLGVREALEYLLSHPEEQTPDPVFDDWCDRVIAAHEAGKAAFAKG